MQPLCVTCTVVCHPLCVTCTIIRQVYNITPYLKYHPGGADILMKAAGKDGTSLFNKYHPWVNAHALLEKCLIGLLHKPGDGEQQQGEQQPAGQSLKSKLVQLFK